MISQGQVIKGSNEFLSESLSWKVTILQVIILIVEINGFGLPRDIEKPRDQLVG